MYHRVSGADPRWHYQRHNACGAVDRRLRIAGESIRSYLHSSETCLSSQLCEWQVTPLQYAGYGVALLGLNLHMEYK